MHTNGARSSARRGDDAVVDERLSFTCTQPELGEHFVGVGADIGAGPTDPARRPWVRSAARRRPSARRGRAPRRERVGSSRGRRTAGRRACRRRLDRSGRGAPRPPRAPCRWCRSRACASTPNQLVELLHPASGDVGRVAGVGRQLGAAHRRGKPGEDRVRVPGDMTIRPSAVGYAFAARRPGSVPPHRVRTWPVAVVGDDRLHQRKDSLVERDVDVLPRPSAPPGAAPRACRTPRTARRSGRRSRPPARRRASGEPVISRMPPIASPMVPNPGSPALGPVWPKPLTRVMTSRGCWRRAPRSRGPTRRGCRA